MMLELLDDDLRRFDGLQRPYAVELRRRLRLLMRWEIVRDAAQARGELVEVATDRFVESVRARGECVSRKTLYGWRRAYQTDGWKGLLDQRRRGARPARPDRAFLEELRRQYLAHSGRLRRVDLCHDLAAEKAKQRGWRVCTLRQSERFIRTEVLPTIARGAGASDGR